MDERVTSLIQRLLDEVRKATVIDGEHAYIRDPVFGIVRNRVHAEVSKAMLRTNNDPLVDLIVNYMVQCQNPDGSWNEIHVNYNQPSALITAFVGEALLEASTRSAHDLSLRRARDFVLACELNSGYFLKSSRYTADHLNVDASCGAFLAKYAEKYSDEVARAAAERAAHHILRHQRNGMFPYVIDRGSYPYTFDLPCIHYQGVTMYYLAKINDLLHDERIDRGLEEGARWLAAAQRPDGRFDWSGSGLLFAYYLSGAYAFAYASFTYAARIHKPYNEHADQCLAQLEKNLDGLMRRWESGSWNDLVPSVYTAAKTASIGQYPLQHTAFRFGYGVYRQIARRRYAKTAESQLFQILCRIFGIRPSTVEPSTNYPDLFMTSEVLDCLSQSLLWRGYA
jgi:hypothetical protein